MGSLRRRRERMLRAAAEGQRAAPAGAGADPKERLPQQADAGPEEPGSSRARPQGPVRAHAHDEAWNRRPRAAWA